MKRNTLIIIISLLSPLPKAVGQEVTYNHDETKMNQVTVMETGAGSLTPAAFYAIVHNKYRKTANETNKLRYRSEAAGHAAVQVNISEQIDTSLTTRAEIEALNMADRQVDLAWQAEGQKIRSALEAFGKNIDRLSEAGGTASDMRVWEERRSLFGTAVSSVRDSYMPNADRKKQYLSIYRDITDANSSLVAYIVQVDSRERAKRNLGARLERNVDVEGIAGDARDRWKRISNEVTE